MNQRNDPIGNQSWHSMAVGGGDNDHFRFLSELDGWLPLVENEFKNRMNESINLQAKGNTNHNLVVIFLSQGWAMGSGRWQ